MVMDDVSNGICSLRVKGGEKTYQRGGAKPYH